MQQRAPWSLDRRGLLGLPGGSSRPSLRIRLVLAPGLALLTGCTCTVPLARVALDLREQEVRTLAIEDAFTLVSPYEARRTVELVNEIRRSLQAVTAALEVEFDQPVYVHMIPLDMEGGEATLDGNTFSITSLPPTAPPTMHGVRGWAGEGEDDVPSFAFFVPRDRVYLRDDGPPLRQTFAFDFAGTIRHELTHLAARRAGLEGPTWFDEGLATEFGATTLEDGVLRPVASPRSLQVARAVHGDFELSALLDWNESGNQVASGAEKAFNEGRPLAHALVRFLLERTPGATLRERLGRIHQLERPELLALEDDWHAWLAGLAEE